MQQVKAICVLCAAIIPTLALAAPASVGDNKFVFVHTSGIRHANFFSFSLQ